MTSKDGSGKPVGRPPLLPSERKHKQAASITDVTLQKARKYFVTIGKAIEWAVEQYESMQVSQKQDRRNKRQ